MKQTTIPITASGTDGAVLRPMPRVQHSLNARPYKGKIYTQPGKTVPDESMSMVNILQRYTSGIPMGNVKTAYYDEDGTSKGINPKTLDLIDIQEMKIQNQEIIDQANEVLQNASKERTKLAEEMKARKIIEDHEKKQAAQETPKN